MIVLRQFDDFRKDSWKSGLSQAEKLTFILITYKIANYAFMHKNPVYLQHQTLMMEIDRIFENPVYLRLKN